MTVDKPITSGQKKQVNRFVADAFESALAESGVHKDGLQRVIERGDELAEIIRKAASKALDDLSISGQYSSEEVKSNIGYLSGYKVADHMERQIETLRSHWPNLNPDRALRYFENVYPKLKQPAWVEGPFVLIRPGYFSNAYAEELAEVLKALAKSVGGKFANYIEGRIGSDYLRETAAKQAALKRIMDQQPGDLLVVGSQFGIRHRGKSVRRAREVCEQSEFIHGAKDEGTMLLTHPTRIAQLNDLWLDAGGDEWSGGDGGLSSAPYFHWSVGRLGVRGCPAEALNLDTSDSWIF